MNSTNFRYVLIGLWGVLIAILPFLVSSSLFFPYITGKNIFFRVIVEILFSLWIFSAIYDKNLRPKWGWVLGIFSGFVIWVGIADFFGTDPLRSFWSNFERMEGYITLLHLFALFIVSVSVMSKDTWYKIISWSVFISSIAWIHGMVERFGNDITRIDSGFGNPTYFAAYALIHVFFALMLAFRNTQYRYMWGILAVLNIVTVYFTGTRGALLGVVGGLVVVAILYAIQEWKNPKIRKFSLGTLGVVAAFVLFLGLAKDTDFVKTSPSLSRFSELATLDIKGFIENAGRSRTSIWGIAMQGFQDRPVLGWGQENFIQVFSTYYNPHIFDQEQWFDRTHNVFFDWLIAAGVLGLLGYLGIFAATLILLWKNKDRFTIHEQIMITGLCAAYFIHTFFVFDNVTSYIYIILVWSFVHHESGSVSQINTKSKDKQRSSSDNSPAAIIAGVLVAIILPCIVNIPVYSTGSNLIQGLVYSYSRESQPITDSMAAQALAYFKKATQGMSFAKGEIREQLVDTNQRIQYSNVSTTTKAAFALFAKEELEAHARERSFDARAEFFAGLYFNSVGDFNQGALHLEASRALSPKKQTILFQLADTYRYIGNTEKALALFKEAYELDVTFAEPALYYAQELARNGMIAESTKVINEISEEKLMDMKYVSLLATVGRFDILSRIFEQAVLNNPRDIQLRMSLAATYVETGKRIEAVTVLEGIIKDFPESKAQIDYFIGEIKSGRNPVKK